MSGLLSEMRVHCGPISINIPRTAPVLGDGRDRGTYAFAVRSDVNILVVHLERFDFPNGIDLEVFKVLYETCDPCELPLRSVHLYTSFTQKNFFIFKKRNS